MNISATTPNSVSLSYVPPEVQSDSVQGSSSSNATETLTLTLTAGGHIEVTGNDGLPVLAEPNGAGESLPELMANLTQQLEDNMNALGLQPTYQDLTNLANAFVALSTPGGFTGTQEELVTMLDGISSRAATLEEQIRGTIENSTYPDFSAFLKDLAELAQKLRESSSEAKQAAIEGKFEMQMAGVELSKTAAQDRYDAATAQISADTTAAIGGLVGAGVGALAGGIGASYGAAGTGAQIFSSVTQLASTTASSSATLEATGDKETARDENYNADIAEAEAKAMDAAAAKQDAIISDYNEIGDSMRTLRDAAVKALQDSITQQSQKIESSASV
jgi:hypothetical protein